MDSRLAGTRRRGRFGVAGVLAISALLAFSVVGALAATPVAQAATVVSLTASNGSRVCAGTLLGSSSVSWDHSTDTCSSVAGLSIPSGTIFEVGGGVTVISTIVSGDGLDNSGTIYNYGTLNATGGSSGGENGLVNSGTINNYGKMNAIGGGASGFVNLATVVNTGTMTGRSTVAGYGFYTRGTLTNRGTVSGTSTVNHGIVNHATIYNFGRMNGYTTGYYDGVWNRGTVDNRGTINGTGGQYGIYQGGVVNNYGTINGTSFNSDGIYNDGNYGGRINNYGTLNGFAHVDGIVNNGYGTALIYNYGTMNGFGVQAGTAISNHGYIYNVGTIYGRGGPTGSTAGGYGVYNPAKIYNVGTIIGTANGYDIYNSGTLYDYCDVVPTGAVVINSPSPVSCEPVTFDQSGIPQAGVRWGVSVTWGPFSIPINETGTGGSISFLAQGPVIYSYLSPVAGPATYICATGCSGGPVSLPTPTISATFTFIPAGTSGSAFTVAVSVYTPGGSPVADGTVVLDGASGVTGLGDSVDFGLGAAGTYPITVTAAGFPTYSASVTISSFTTELTITLGTSSGSTGSAPGAAYTSTGASQTVVGGSAAATASFTNTGSSSQTVDVWFVWYNQANQVVNIGEQLNVQFGAGQTISFTGTYSVPGTYDVKIFVTNSDAAGLSAAYSTAVTVP